MHADDILSYLVANNYKADVAPFSKNVSLYGTEMETFNIRAVTP